MNAAVSVCGFVDPCDRWSGLCGFVRTEFQIRWRSARNVRELSLDTKLCRVKSSAALQRLAQAIAAEGFSGIKMNKQLASIEAFQETTGSGRIQTLRVTARAQGKSTRVDAVFTIQAGQATSKSVVREGLCRIIASAAN